MSNIDLRFVPVATVTSMCEEMGCVVTELKSFIRIQAPTDNKKCLYIGKAKKFMTRLDVSGFVPEAIEGLYVPEDPAAHYKALALGAVRAQVFPKKIREESTDVLAIVRHLVTSVLSDEDGFKLGLRKTPDVTEETTEDETTDEDSTLHGLEDVVEAALGEEEDLEAVG